jgi:hypothetical protein
MSDGESAKEAESKHQMLVLLRSDLTVISRPSVVL